MSKQKFTSADVRAMVRDLKESVIGKRLANVYDLSERTYLFKFSGHTSTDKSMLLIESGIRFHLTQFVRNTPNLPSPFAMKLRRHIRTKRLEAINQLGYDRVVDLKFGSGEATNHIIIELYAGGNIVLTDGNYEVIALLRSHQFSEDVVLKVGEIYPVAYSTNLVTAGNNEKEETTTTLITGPCQSPEAFLAWIEAKKNANNLIETVTDMKGNTKKSKPSNLKQLLLNKDSGISHLGPEIIEHCLLHNQLKQNAKPDTVKQLSTEQLSHLLQSFQEGVSLLDQLQGVMSKGYIILEKNGSSNYAEYAPFVLLQHQGSPFQEFATFSTAVDEYYYRIEDQKMVRELQSKEEAAKKKIAKVQEDQEKLVQQLVEQRKHLEAGAMLLEIHASEVEKVRAVLNSWIENDLSWTAIEDMVEETKTKGNPVAKLISRLKLDQNIAVLKFPRQELLSLLHNDSDSEGDEEEPTAESDDFLEVEINLSLTALANARELHQDRKAAEHKEMKTLAANSKVLQTVEEQTLKNLEKQKISHTIKAARKVHWFEKFNWFITTEGFLVLSGKDAQQNELLFKRYLRPEDIYVHADIHGASSCIVRAKRKLSHEVSIDVPNAIQHEDKYFVTPLAIQEAGVFAVCRSRAWDAKIITSSYWVRASQVSKTAPPGEFLTMGSLMIYGKKNYLPPMPLEMGFGILFRLEDNSVAKHLHERKIKTYEMDDESVVSYQDAVERYGIEEEQEISLPPTIPEQPEEDDKESEDGDEFHNDGDDNDGKEEEEKSDSFDASQVEEDEEDLIATVATETSAVNQNEANSSSIIKEEERGNGEFPQKASKKNPTSTGKKGSSDVRDLIPPSLPAPRSTSPTTTNTESKANKKKHVNKKKARRYAEQDEEDRELAMMVLGHASAKGEHLNDRITKATQEKKKEDIKQRQLKAGINLLQNSNWSKLVDLQLPPIRDEIQRLIQDQLLQEGDINEDEMKNLSLFSVEDGVKILNLYRDSKQVQKIVNKSSFLGGIMRRIMKENGNKKKIIVSSNTLPASPSIIPKTNLNEKEREAEEQKEVEQLKKDEGIIDLPEEDEEDLKFSDDIDKLYPNPTAEDIILYAVPVCAPYLSMKNFKFRVKLTPGSVKKGKAVKQAMDLFIRSKECSSTEKNVLKNLNDHELTSVMIGDVKLSMPGMFQQINKQHKKQKGQK